MKFNGSFWVEAENRGFWKKLTLYKTEREDIKPSIAIDQLQQTKWTIQNFQNTTNRTNQSEKDRKIPNYEKLFER